MLTFVFLAFFLESCFRYSHARQTDAAWARLADFLEASLKQNEQRGVEMYSQEAETGDDMKIHWTEEELEALLTVGIVREVDGQAVVEGQGAARNDDAVCPPPFGAADQIPAVNAGAYGRFPDL